jgi:hypothetical protein
MKPLFIILKITFFLLAILVMYFASHFSIGSRGAWINASENRFWEFYFSRLFFTLIAGGVFFLLSILLNWAFRNKINYKRKMVLFEIAAIVFVALIMISIAILK